MDAAEIRQRRAQHPKMRERDFARLHNISEARLVAAHIGHGVTRLRPDVSAILEALPAVGEVMALTRNESAVHEKIGPYEKVRIGGEAGTVLGEQIDLRVFPRHWISAFAVEKTDESGALKRSLQFFDGAGDAVHKVHLRDASNLTAYTALVERFTMDEQSDALPAASIATDSFTREPAGREELHVAWRALTDTHQFHGMLRKLSLHRLDALSMAETDLAWRLDLGATPTMLADAVTAEVPIMAFVGSSGCIQIHSGPIHNVAPMGPWINIMDETFHLHLRLDHITELWAVRKPTKDGHVTSIEAYAADRSLIIQFFGVRHEGIDELPGWRSIVEALPRLVEAARQREPISA
jgi:putative hemin transport protein